jgi:PAS domain S-box-containing protein
MATGELENIEEKYVHEGQTRIVHTVKTPVRDENGDPIGVVGIFWDVTEQKRNEEELRKNCTHLEELVSNRTAELQTANKQLQREVGERRRMEERLREVEGMYRALLENTGSATVVMEEDMVISLANREFEKLSGYSKEGVEGKKSLKEFVAPADLERIKSYLTGKTNLDTVPGYDEGRFMAQAGDERDIRITAAMIPGVKKAVVSLLDVTDRRRAEGSLRTWQEKYQALAENVKEAILVMQEGQLKFCNSKIFGISGYTEGELTSKPFKELIHPDDREMFELTNRKLVQEKLSRVQLLRLMHKDKHIRWVENRGALIQWEGKPAVLNYMTDVTDRKQAEEELRNSIEPFRGLVNALEKYFSV